MATAKRFAKCKKHFAGGNTAGWGLKPDLGCPAGIAPRGDKAKNAAECDTIVATDYTDKQVKESRRLLNHEQGHFAISCVLTKKINATLGGGKAYDQVVAVIPAKLGPTQTQYDNETNHGCNAGPQATWDSEIAKGLPAIQLL